MTKHDHEPPTPEHGRLRAFVGTWRTEGEVRATRSSPLAPFRAVDVYEWLPGGFFLVHRWDAKMPEGDSSGIEILGFDTTSRTYFIHSFDNQGNLGVMEGIREGDRWTFTGEALRFRGEFGEGGSALTGMWEQRSPDGLTWVPWMDVRLTRKA